MSDMVDDGKRDFLKQAALFGAASGAVGAAMAPERDAGANPGNRRARRLGSGEMPQGRRAACRLRADRALVLQGRQDRRTQRHLQGRGRSTGEGNPGQGRLEGSHLRERDGRAAARRLRPVRLVADLSGASARSRSILSAPIIQRARLLLCHKDNAGRFKTAADANKCRCHVLGHLRRERGAAHSAAVPRQAEDHHDDRPGRRSGPSRCAPRGPTCGSAATAT